MTDSQKEAAWSMSRLTVPEKVRAAEQAYITKRRGEAGVAPNEKDGPPVGLALSGGGIRSATFCLGVLQTLAERGVLPLADYMCTVSGGGYIGSCLSSLTTQRPPADEHPTASDDRTADDELATDAWRRTGDFDAGPRIPLSDPTQIHHLRRHGDFLISRRGLFRREVLRTAGTLVLGLLCTLGIFAAALLIIVGLLLCFGGWFGVTPPAGDETSATTIWKAIGTWPGWGPAIGALSPDRGAAAVQFGIGAAIGFIALCITTIGRAFFSTAGRPTGETPEECAERRWLYAFGLLVGLGIAISLAVHLHLDGGVDPGTPVTATLEADVSTLAAAASPPAFPHLLLPAAAMLGALLSAWGTYVIVALFAAPFAWTRESRSMLGAEQGICLNLLLLLLLAPALMLTTWWVEAEGVGPTIGSGAGLMLLLTRLLAKRGGDPREARGFMAKLKAKTPRIILAIAVPVLVLAAIVLVTSLTLKLAPPFGPMPWYGNLALLIGVVFFVGLGFLLNINRLSPHYFYRDRLVETYLQTEKRDEDGLRLMRDDADLRVANLHDDGTAEAESTHSDPYVPTNASPYHLILCALNLAGSRDLARRDRKSDHFIISREYCGSATTGYAPTKQYRNGKLKLARAMTMSGAAASSLMGFHTSFAQAFAMTLFNIRLGYWLLNPNRCDGVVFPEGVPHSEPRLPGWLGSLLRGRNQTSEFATFWPWYLAQETIAWTNAQSRLVNLSDGQHTGDNIGLYPLLQRRCRLIIACDAECDPEYTFGSLAEAIRQIYTDENVTIDIDLDRIRPVNAISQRRELGRAYARDHFVIGRITYPNVDPEHGGSSKTLPQEPELGWLIYLKSSLVAHGSGEEHGDFMPATILAYADRHADFPHETTADQFFGDDQFEAYRALGAHVTEALLDEIPVETRSGAANETPEICTAAKLVKWCEGHFAPTKTPVMSTASAEPGEPITEARVRAALEAECGKKEKTRARLGIGRTRFSRLLDDYGIDPSSYRQRTSRGSS